MPARLTDTARRQGWKNAAIVVPTLLLAVWILGKLLSLIYGQDRIDTQRFAFLGSWGLILLISLVRWIYGKAIGGKVLLDCGPFPGKWGYLVVGVVIGFLCCSHPFSPSEVLSIEGFWFPVSLAAYFLVAAFGRLQVRENGIMQYWSLLRWEKIASYSWAEDSTLLLNPRSRFSLRAALPVPPEQKQAVDELLTRFCPVILATGGTVAKLDGLDD